MGANIFYTKFYQDIDQNASFETCFQTFLKSLIHCSKCTAKIVCFFYIKCNILEIDDELVSLLNFQKVK